MKKVLVTGILGQDGANMAEYLLARDEPIKVYGMMNLQHLLTPHP